jgi:hypothetical protein
MNAFPFCYIITKRKIPIVASQIGGSNIYLSKEMKEKYCLAQLRQNKALLKE